MAKKVQPIISASGGTPRGGQLPSATLRGIDRVLAIQRPVVLAHIRGIRRRNPDATPAQIVRILERRYLAAVTTGGAAVGATAVVPAIGTGITLALSGIETAGFLEATALFAQSVSEVHGIAVDDPDRARALVMTMMLGKEGSDLVRNWAGQATGGVAGGGGRNRYWGEMITSGLPQLAVGPLADRLKSRFIKQFAVRGGTGILGKAIPFGIGAVIGGTGNHMLGRKVLHSSRLAFGMPPDVFPLALAPRPRTVRLGPSPAARIGASTRSAAATTTVAVGKAATQTVSTVGKTASATGSIAKDIATAGTRRLGSTARKVAAINPLRGRSAKALEGKTTEPEAPGPEPTQS